MLLQESRDNVGTEGEGDTTVVFAPARYILVWIRPEKIAQQTAIRDLILISKSSGPLPVCRELARKVEQKKFETYISWAHDAADLFHGVQIGTQTSVHCENLLIDDCRNGQAVEAVCESLPKLDVIPSLAFVVEPIDAVDGSAFVVAA
jgi:hypothetical protein